MSHACAYDRLEHFVRIGARLRSVWIPGLEVTTQGQPHVQFQQIRYGGLLGTDFLDRFRHTFDVRGERLVLHPR